MVFSLSTWQMTSHKVRSTKNGLAMFGMEVPWNHLIIWHTLHNTSETGITNCITQSFAELLTGWEKLCESAEASNFLWAPCLPLWGRFSGYSISYLYSSLCINPISAPPPPPGVFVLCPLCTFHISASPFRCICTPSSVVGKASGYAYHLTITWAVPDTGTNLLTDNLLLYICNKGNILSYFINGRFTLNTDSEYCITQEKIFY